ncbi:MAG: glycosyltransferase family 4 protein [Acidimicrobiales bacterium]
MRSGLRVLAAPRDDNPYQELLYRELRSEGATVRYAEGPSASQTLNIALSPFLLLVYRARGYQVLHLHWVFQFQLPWAHDRRWAKRAVQTWFAFYLWVATVLGYAIVWTAHDIVPHEQVFADDEAAHRHLVKRASVVVALSAATSSELQRLGARRVKVVPFGPFAHPDLSDAARRDARTSLGLSEQECVMLHLGKLSPYKGTDLLLSAAASLPPGAKFRVLVVGPCQDGKYRGLLHRLAAPLGERASLRLERVSNDEMGRYLLASDVAVLPFREISNSSAVLTAQCYGLPVIVPSLANLADIPPDAVLRYDGTAKGLVRTLGTFLAMPPPQRRALAEAGRAFAMSWDWKAVALAMAEAYSEALSARSLASRSLWKSLRKRR